MLRLLASRSDNLLGEGQICGDDEPYAGTGCTNGLECDCKKNQDYNHTSKDEPKNCKCSESKGYYFEQYSY